MNKLSQFLGEVFDLKYQGNYSRTYEVDIVKGMLVIIMLVFHCALPENKHFISSFYFIIYNKIVFIHYAFIILSGFLIGWHYYPLLEKRNSDVKARLMIRGLKLLLIIIVLNVCLYISGIFKISYFADANKSLTDFLYNFIFNINGKLIALDQVYPISIILIISSLLISRNCLIIFIFFTGICLFIGNPEFSILKLLAYGFEGIILGILICKGYLLRVWRFLKKGNVVYIFLFCIYLYVTEIPIIKDYILNSIFKNDKIFFFYISFDSLCWFIFFIFIIDNIKINFIYKIINLLSKYTLLGYISQMMIIRIVKHFIMNSYILIFLVSLIFLCLFLSLLEVSRNRNNFIDNCYKIIFN